MREKEDITDFDLLFETMRERSIEIWGLSFKDPVTEETIRVILYNNYSFRFSENGDFLDGHQYIGKRWRDTRMLYCRALDLIRYGSTINKPEGDVKELAKL